MTETSQVGPVKTSPLWKFLKWKTRALQPPPMDIELTDISGANLHLPESSSATRGNATGKHAVFDLDVPFEDFANASNTTEGGHAGDCADAYDLSLCRDGGSASSDGGPGLTNAKTVPQLSLSLLGVSDSDEIDHQRSIAGVHDASSSGDMENAMPSAPVLSSKWRAAGVAVRSSLRLQSQALQLRAQLDQLVDQAAIEKDETPPSSTDTDDEEMAALPPAPANVEVASGAKITKRTSTVLMSDDGEVYFQLSNGETSWDDPEPQFDVAESLPEAVCIPEEGCWKVDV